MPCVGLMGGGEVGPTEGTFGGAIGGGFKKDKSFTSDCAGDMGSGTGTEMALKFASSVLLRSPKKSGGGRTNAPGGGGGATEGWGGTKISSSSRFGTDIKELLGK